MSQDSLIVVQLGSTVQVNKHQHTSETGAAIQHLALTAQAGSVPLLILSAVDGTVHALELNAKPSPHWSLNTPAAVTSARIVDCAPRPRDTTAQSLLVCDHQFYLLISEHEIYSRIYPFFPLLPRFIGIQLISLPFGLDFLIGIRCNTEYFANIARI